MGQPSRARSRAGCGGSGDQRRGKRRVQGKWLGTRLEHAQHRGDQAEGARQQDSNARATRDSTKVSSHDLGDLRGVQRQLRVRERLAVSVDEGGRVRSLLRRLLDPFVHVRALQVAAARRVAGGWRNARCSAADRGRPRTVKYDSSIAPADAVITRHSSSAVDVGAEPPPLPPPAGDGAGAGASMPAPIPTRPQPPGGACRTRARHSYNRDQSTRSPPGPRACFDCRFVSRAAALAAVRWRPARACVIDGTSSSRHWILYPSCPPANCGGTLLCLQEERGAHAISQQRAHTRVQHVFLPYYINPRGRRFGAPVRRRHRAACLEGGRARDALLHHHRQEADHGGAAWRQVARAGRGGSAPTHATRPGRVHAKRGGPPRAGAGRRRRTSSAVQ